MKKTSTGPTTPPSVANNGLMDFAIGLRLPRQAGLGDFLGGDPEEEHHEDVVDEPVMGDEMAEDLEVGDGHPVLHMLVGLVIQVGPDHRHHHAG